LQEILASSIWVPRPRIGLPTNGTRMAPIAHLADDDPTGVAAGAPGDGAWSASIPFVQLRFHIDPETGEPHIYQHGVTEEEVEEVLRRPGDDFQARKGSRIALGQTDAGRFLQVVYVLDKDRLGAFVVTAYDLVGKALAAYRRRRRM
jgi:hypothetical protein